MERSMERRQRQRQRQRQMDRTKMTSISEGAKVQKVQKYQVAEDFGEANSRGRAVWPSKEAKEKMCAFFFREIALEETIEEYVVRTGT